jgi:hypothetical protein
MTSDIGRLKIGMSNDPVWRLGQVKAQFSNIKRLTHAWGMSRQEAVIIERAAHKRLSLVSLGYEMFRLRPDTAARVIEGLLAENGIPAVPFDCVRKPKKIGRPPSGVPTSPLTIRLDDDLRRRGEIAAKTQNRSFASLVTHALARVVTAHETAAA